MREKHEPHDYTYAIEIIKKYQSERYSLDFCAMKAGLPPNYVYRLAKIDPRFRELVDGFRFSRKKSLSVKNDLGRVLIYGLRDASGLSTREAAEKLGVSVRSLENMTIGGSRVSIEVFMGLLKIANEGLYNQIMSLTSKNIKNFKIEE